MIILRSVIFVEERNKIEAVTNKLKHYKQFLAGEQRSDKIEKIGSFFHINAKSNQKIDAIDKAIQILNDVDVDLFAKDLKLLKQQPIKNILGPLIAKLMSIMPHRIWGLAAINFINPLTDEGKSGYVCK